MVYKYKGQKTHLFTNVNNDKKIKKESEKSLEKLKKFVNETIKNYEKNNIKKYTRNHDNYKKISAECKKISTDGQILFKIRKKQPTAINIINSLSNKQNVSFEGLKTLQKALN